MAKQSISWITFFSQGYTFYKLKMSEPLGSDKHNLIYPKKKKIEKCSVLLLKFQICQSKTILEMEINDLEQCLPTFLSLENTIF